MLKLIQDRFFVQLHSPKSEQIKTWIRKYNDMTSCKEQKQWHRFDAKEKWIQVGQRGIRQSIASAVVWGKGLGLNCATSEEMGYEK